MFRRIPRRAGRAVFHSAAAQQFAHGNLHRQGLLHRARRPRRRLRCARGGGDHRDHGLRGFGRGRGRGRQSARLPQLERADEGRLKSLGKKRRGNHRARTAARPGIHRRRRRAAAAARAQSDVRAQCRRAHVHRRGDAGRRGNSGDFFGRDGHLARGQARPARQRPLSQQRDRQHLHRQAENARARGSGGRGGIVRARGGGARSRAEHHQDRRHGRGAAHHGEFKGVHSRRGRARGVHQHRLPRPHRGRNSRLHGGRRGSAERRHEKNAVAARLRGLECGRRACRRAAGTRANRQGHVGRAGQHGANDGAKVRASARRREHRLGAVAVRGGAACAALPPC